MATVATAGACGLVAAAAIGSLKWALIGSAIGAAGGAFKGALSYMEENDTLDGSGSHILEESAKGFSKGAITGAVSGAMAGAAKYAKNPSGYCFVSGTLVLTLAGLIAIENVRPGDMVYAKEAVGIEQSVDTDAQATLNSVLEIYEREVYETYRLTLDGEEIETTANHPFYTEDGEAVEAGDLKEGDKLSTADGESATVEQTEKIIHNEPVKVYNFAVIDTHTYYVGEVGVLVHNMCTGASLGTFEKWGKSTNDNITSLTKKVKVNNLEPNQGYTSFNKLKHSIGSAGEGKDWHHIVEKSQIKKSGFSPQLIHNTSNIISVDHATHMKITGYYNTTTFEFTKGVSVRNWLSGKSFEEQYDFGIKILRDFGVLE